MGPWYVLRFGLGFSVEGLGIRFRGRNSKDSIGCILLISWGAMGVGFYLIRCHEVYGSICWGSMLFAARDL